MLETIKTQVQEYFKNLNFEPNNHVYTYNNLILPSVSSVIKKYSEPFEADKIAGFVAKKRGITKEEVLQEWQDIKNKACEVGTNTHLFGETYNAETSKPTNGLEEAVSKFWTDLPEHIKIVTFELKMYHKIFGIAGTSDIIFYNTKTGKFIIADYKTNGDLFKNYKEKKLLKPFENLLDNPYNKYQIQLSLYQLLFEQTGYEVEARKVIWLKPDGNYVIYNTDDLTEVLSKQLVLA